MQTSKNSYTTDFIIIGAGILGLSTALKLLDAYPRAKISILDKEGTVGEHASGRNSGVLHSGIYYPPDSLKAKLCGEGAKAMRTYCQEHNLPWNKLGKVIIPTQADDENTLRMLYERGLLNGVSVEWLDEAQLAKLEPLARTATGRALWVPETTVVDPKAIMLHLHQSLAARGVKFYFNACCDLVDVKTRSVRAGVSTWHYQHLINTAGLYADKVAHACGLRHRYTMLPFKGLYYEIKPTSQIKINHLIYPVPDMNVPFLGVHFTKSVSGKVYVGPTAVPALGREQYRGLNDMNIKEAMPVLYHLLRQYKNNEQGFRNYTHREVLNFLKPKFVNTAKTLVPNLTSGDLSLSGKVGIRAQLLDTLSRRLVMDFLIEQTGHETHILNAVSPAFTSAFGFSDYVVGLIKTKQSIPV